MYVYVLVHIPNERQFQGFVIINSVLISTDFSSLALRQLWRIRFEFVSLFVHNCLKQIGHKFILTSQNLEGGRKRKKMFKKIIKKNKKWRGCDSLRPLYNKMRLLITITKSRSEVR